MSIFSQGWAGLGDGERHNREGDSWIKVRGGNRAHSAQGLRPESCLSCLCLGTMSSLDMSSSSPALLGSSAGQHVCLAAPTVQHGPPDVLAGGGSSSWVGWVCVCVLGGMCAPSQDVPRLATPWLGS